MHYWKRHKAKRLFAHIGPQLKVGCYFQAEKYRSDGTITYRGPRFANTILNIGLDNLASYPLGLRGGNGSWSNNASVLNVGTSSTAPAVTQSGLQTYLASTATLYGSTTHGYDLTDPMHRWSEAVYEFSIGSCTGNLTELGLSHDTNSDYFNRQLFRDTVGDPTTITVLSDEGLRVTVTLYLYSDLQNGEQENSSLVISGDTIATVREVYAGSDSLTWLTYDPVDAMAHFGALVEDGVQLSASATGYTGGTDADSYVGVDYVAGNYYKEATFTWNAGTFVGDIASIYYCAMFPPPYGGVGTRDTAFSAFRLTPVVTIADTEAFILTVRRSWGRYVA